MTLPNIIQFVFLCALFCECKSCLPPWKNMNDFMPQNVFNQRKGYLSRKSTQNCADFPEWLRRRSHFQKIINGFETEKPLPYQLYIEVEFLKDGISYTAECGGTLIAPDLVISAHHCFEGIKDGKINVYGNLYDLTSRRSQKRKVEMIFAPYTTSSILKTEELQDRSRIDMVILKVSKPFTYPMQPACLPSKPIEPRENSRCFVSGWGKTIGNVNPNQLRAAEIVLSDRKGLESCHIYSFHHTGSRKYSQKYEICAHPSWEASCVGDSGGPVVCEENGKAVLHGVVSWGIELNSVKDKCYHSSSIYANVYSLMDFIEDVLKNGQPTKVFCSSADNPYWGNYQCTEALNNPENCYDGGDCDLVKYMS